MRSKGVYAAWRVCWVIRQARSPVAVWLYTVSLPRLFLLFLIPDLMFPYFSLAFSAHILRRVRGFFWTHFSRSLFISTFLFLVLCGEWTQWLVVNQQHNGLLHKWFGGRCSHVKSWREGLAVVSGGQHTAGSDWRAIHVKSISPACSLS